MKTYHKIQSIYKREPQGKRLFIEGDYSLSEFELLKDIQWICTEKVDGMNIRIGWDGTTVRLGGRTNKAQLPAELVARLEDLFLARHALFMETFGIPFGDNQVCFYGEGYGAKIQKGGGLYSATQEFVLFDVRVGNTWLKREHVVDIAAKFGLKVVPVVYTGTLDEAVQFVKDGQDSVWGDFQAEGVVARPAVELKTRMGERIITKIKHKDFE